MDDDRRLLKDQTPTRMTVRAQGGGFLFGIGGLLLALAGVARMVTLLPSYVDCSGTSLSLSGVRISMAAAVVAGIVAILLCEIGVRRAMQAKWIGVAGSVIGVFVTMASGVLLLVTFTDVFSGCF